MNKPGPNTVHTPRSTTCKYSKRRSTCPAHVSCGDVANNAVHRMAKRGIWKGGPKLKETPAEYKRKYAKDAEAAE